MNTPSQSLRHIWLPQFALLLILTGIAYSAVRDHYFVWDTIPFVLENPWIHGWSFSNTLSILTEAHRANWHPLVLFSHAVDFSLFGQNSGAHHLMNLGYHLINASLVYLLIYRLLLVNQCNRATDRRKALWIAWLTALIFAIHPQHVESVAWVVERKDVLYSLFTLLTLLAYLNSTQTENWKSKLLPLVMFALALCAKPMAVTLPVILLLLDFYPLRRINSVRQFAWTCLNKAPYFLLSGAVVLITLSTQSIAMPNETRLPLWVSALNAINNTWFYVQHYIWPLELSPFYPYPQNMTYLRSPDFWLPGTLFLGSILIGGSVLFYRGYRWPMVLALCYLVTLAPVSGLIHVGPAKATDHYVYLATLPISLATALGLSWLWSFSRRLQVPVAAITACYLFGLLLVTQLQVSYWNNPLSLWTRVVTLYPNSAFGHRNLAAAYVQIDDWDMALYHAEQSLLMGSPDRKFVEGVRKRVGGDAR
tara:strand:- start:48 stop:1481 length:1434 start_codon:yes stop_codon:yes gene_type:complete